MADLNKMEAELNRLEQQKRNIIARQQRQLARFNTEKRKQRTKRLIEKGAILETFQSEVNGKLTPVKKVPRVTKKEDPEGYEAYQAYQEAQKAKEEWNEKITPKQSSKWLREAQKSFNETKKALAEAKNASQELERLIKFTKSCTDNSGTSVYDLYLENQRTSNQSQNVNGASQNEQQY